MSMEVRVTRIMLFSVMIRLPPRQVLQWLCFLSMLPRATMCTSLFLWQDWRILPPRGISCSLPLIDPSPQLLHSFRYLLTTLRRKPFVVFHLIDLFPYVWFDNLFYFGRFLWCYDGWCTPSYDGWWVIVEHPSFPVHMMDLRMGCLDSTPIPLFLLSLQMMYLAQVFMERRARPLRWWVSSFLQMNRDAHMHLTHLTLTTSLWVIMTSLSPQILTLAPLCPLRYILIIVVNFVPFHPKIGQNVPELASGGTKCQLRKLLARNNQN